MRPEQLAAIKSVCYSQEDLQAVFDKPFVYNFTKKLQAWVTICVAQDGPDKELTWSACIRLANPLKRNFKPQGLWTVHETIRARNILHDQLSGVGNILGEEEFTTTKGLHLNKCLTKEEKWVALRPEVLGD